MDRRNFAAIAVIIIFSILSAPRLPAQTRTASPPAAAAAVQYSFFCFAAEGRTTAYFTNVFDGAATNLSDAGREFSQYLDGKYAFKGRGVCTIGGTHEQARTLLDQQLASLRKQGTNVIQTSWVFDATAAAKPNPAAAVKTPPAAAVPAPAAAPVPAPAAPAQNPNPAAASSAAAAARPRNPVPTVPAPAATAPAPAAPAARPSATTPAPAAASNTISAYCISDESKTVIYVSDVFDTGMGQQTSDATAFLNLTATAYNFADYLKSKYSYTTKDDPGAGCYVHGDAVLVQQERQKWQAAQQAAKKQIVAATWKFTPASMKLTSAPAPAQPAPSASLPSGPGVLTWLQTVQKDQLTDETWTETGAGATIGQAQALWILNVTTKCTNSGFRFILSVSDKNHSTAQMPFSWAKNDTGDSYIPMRIRIDSAAAHQTIAFADSDGEGPTRTEYINAPVLLFYDARGIESSANNAIPLTGLGAFDGFIGALTRDASKASAQQMENDAAGSLAQLANATSIRVEIPLFDGQHPIVDLNPRDKVLQPVIQKCSAKLR